MRHTNQSVGATRGTASAGSSTFRVGTAPLRREACIIPVVASSDARPALARRWAANALRIPTTRPGTTMVRRRSGPHATSGARKVGVRHTVTPSTTGPNSGGRRRAGWFAPVRAGPKGPAPKSLPPRRHLSGQAWPMQVRSHTDGWIAGFGERKIPCEASPGPSRAAPGRRGGRCPVWPP